MLKNQFIEMKTLIACLILSAIISPLSSHARCECDLVLHNRTTGDGLQSLDFADMPDSTSSLFQHIDTTGWLELLVPYAHIIDTSGSVKPGASICLGQIKRRVYLKNVLGDSWNPIVIKNYPGTVSEISSEPSYAGLQIHNSKHFEVRGDCGLADSVYGIFIHGVNANGVEVSGMSEEFTITRVKVDTAGTGIKVKDDRDGYYSSCVVSPGATAPTDSTWYASNIFIENCSLGNITNEGIYMNNTSYKYDYGCDQNLIYFGYEMDGVYIRDNLIYNAGMDGVQATGVVRSCIISGNRILNVGTQGNATQGNGIHFGEGSSGKVFNNWVEKTSGVGIFSAGLGAIDIYQNVVLQTTSDGIRAHAGTWKCEGSCKYSNEPSYFGLNNYYDLERLSIFNNTVAYTGDCGIRIKAPVEDVKLKKLYVNNNVITEWTNDPLYFISSPTANYDGFTHAGNNFIRVDISEVGFLNATMNTTTLGPDANTDVRLTATSGACDNGIDLLWTSDSPAEFIGLDFDGNSREQQSRTDCGAYESAYSMDSGYQYLSTALCDCALPKEIYGFDGEELEAGGKVCLLDTLRAGRIWFKNVNGSNSEPVHITAIEPLSISMSYNSNAMAFDYCSNLDISGETIKLSAANDNYGKIHFSTNVTGNLLISDLDITGGDRPLDISYGYGTNLPDTVVIRNVVLEGKTANKDLIHVKGRPSYVKLENVKVTSNELNQALLSVNLEAGGDFGVYNSIFDGFDTDQSVFRWIWLAMQPVNGSYEANSVRFINNTFINLANSNSDSTNSNFRILHKSGSGFIDTLNFVNNAIHKSAIQDNLTPSNYKNNANRISIFGANYEVVSNNVSVQILDSLHIDSDYRPEESLNSPLFNTGIQLSYSEVKDLDFYGNIRPDSIYGLVDIGACELQPESLQYSSSSFSSESLESYAFEQQAMIMYPNPTSDELNLTGLEEGDEIVISDGRGEMFFNEKIDSPKDKLEIAVRNWKRGHYYLRVVQNEEDVFYKHLILTGR